jgi:small multidrug resistance family-3 protein
MWLLVPMMLLAAAVLEVGGDAIIRLGLRGGRPLPIAPGMLVLGVYGTAVNQVRWDFGRLLGGYVGVFAW